MMLATSQAISAVRLTADADQVADAPEHSTLVTAWTLCFFTHVLESSSRRQKARRFRGRTPYADRRFRPQ